MRVLIVAALASVAAAALIECPAEPYTASVCWTDDAENGCQGYWWESATAAQADLVEGAAEGDSVCAPCRQTTDGTYDEAFTGEEDLETGGAVFCGYYEGGICDGKCTSSTKQDDGTASGCYCDGQCVAEGDCCEGRAASCETDDNTDSTCAQLDDLLSSNCGGADAYNIYRPAWVIALKEVGRDNGCDGAVPAGSAAQPDNNRCVSAREFNYAPQWSEVDSDGRGLFLQFACAGATNEIVVRECLNNDCDDSSARNGCEVDANDDPLWRPFNAGSVAAGKCFDPETSDTRSGPYLFVCDLPEPPINLDD